MQQIFNPYLPCYEYIPDGEPHVFGDRLYIFGSHDRFNGDEFCLNDYICYSCNVTDLTKWKYEGIILKKEQDPRNKELYKEGKRLHAQWAPDVVKGPDGRYYLYYCLDYLPEIAVAVCDSPAGKYEFYGFVQHADGSILGQRNDDLAQFDPAVYMDNGKIYLYSGQASMFQDQYDEKKQAQVMTLEKDMITLASEPRCFLPDIRHSKGTGFEGHEFFEASSIRKIGEVYYMIYSSVQSHELCYATSSRPDGEFSFGGTIVDIGDVFLHGRTEEQAVNPYGNTHGSIEYVNGQWYVFYHRQTNRTNFSRQGCAEKIEIQEDGKILQTEVTSCGLNHGALDGNGIYPAYICCHHTGAKGTKHSNPHLMEMNYPYLTQDTDDLDPENDMGNILAMEYPAQYVANIKNGDIIGFKYFHMEGKKRVRLELRGIAKGKIYVYCIPKENFINNGGLELKPECAVTCADVEANEKKWNWTEFSNEFSVDGDNAIYFVFEGNGVLDFDRFELLYGETKIAEAVE